LLYARAGSRRYETAEGASSIVRTLAVSAQPGIPPPLEEGRRVDLRSIDASRPLCNVVGAAGTVNVAWPGSEQGRVDVEKWARGNK
jgi:hypothetical protein